MKQFNAKLGPLVLQMEWRLTLFTLLLLPALLALGFWQLGRAEEKQFLADRHATRIHLPPLSETELIDTMAANPPLSWPDLLADRRITLTGQIHPYRYVWLDNKTRQGRFGYELIIFLQTAYSWAPVNLGWIEGDPARRSLPIFPVSPGLVTLTGRLYLQNSPSFTLDDPMPVIELPAVVQQFDPDTFAPALFESGSSVAGGLPLLPLQIRIEAAQPLALIADWPVLNQSSAKHTGYAVQWFTMSAVLFLAYILGSSNLWALLCRHRSSMRTP